MCTPPHIMVGQPKKPSKLGAYLLAPLLACTMCFSINRFHALLSTKCNSDWWNGMRDACMSCAWSPFPQISKTDLPD